jgi:hypothetical protein
MRREIGGQVRGRRQSIATALVLGCALASGCTSETVFLSSFNSTGIGSTPAAVQAVGTATSSGDSGSVIVDTPIPGSTEKWVRITRAPSDAAPISIFQGNFSKMPGQGTYGMLAVLLVSSDMTGNNAEDLNNGSASVELRPVNDQLRYVLHLDFLPKQPPGHMIRINDDPQQTFGTFPVDQPFTVSITIVVASSTAHAQVSLVGNGTSGDAPNITIPDASLAAQIRAARFWIGWPWRGHFEATDVIVTHKNW